jgi:hypothetical protein
MAKKITKFSLLNIFINLLTLKIINAIALYLLQFLTNFLAIATLGLSFSLRFEPFIRHGILRSHRLDFFLPNEAGWGVQGVYRKANAQYCSDKEKMNFCSRFVGANTPPM